MTSKSMEQRAAIFLACKLPMASEEIAGTAVYRTVAPIGVQVHGMTLPVAGLPWSGNAPAMSGRKAVVDRVRATALGPAPRGRPV